PQCSFADNIAKLLRELAGVPAARRTARFRCIIAIAAPGRASGDFAARVAACRVSLHEGRVDGRILAASRGQGGFGYDPVFWLPDLGKTLAELSMAEKNQVSHRARALAAARRALQDQLRL